MTDYVIELNSVGGPCWVATGGGDPERTHLIECAEKYATEHEAMESAAAFRSKYPNRKFFVRVKPLSNALGNSAVACDRPVSEANEN